MRKVILVIGLLVSVLLSGEIKLLDENAKDFSYQLPLKKYPKFLCEATLSNGKVVQFVSVKAMMQVNDHQKYFKKHKFIDADIKEMFVQDYLSGKKVKAKDATYVFGSKVVGPHGDDLIPFSSLDGANLFKIKFGGTRTMSFDQITLGLIRYLDM